MYKKTLNKKQRTIVALCAALLVIGSSIWYWEDVLKDQLIPKRWGTVEEGLIYRSGSLSPSLAEKTLKKYEIKVIVDLTSESPDSPPRKAQESAAEKLGIEVKRYPLGGNGTGDINSYIQALETIINAHNNRKPVLVHCVSGTQRTGGVIACYRFLVQHKSPEYVYKEMRKYDWVPRKNPDIIDYLNENLPVIAENLKDKGMIETIPEPLPVFLFNLPDQ